MRVVDEVADEIHEDGVPHAAGTARAVSGSEEDSADRVAVRGLPQGDGSTVFPTTASDEAAEALDPLVRPHVLERRDFLVWQLEQGGEAGPQAVPALPVGVLPSLVDGDHATFLPAASAASRGFSSFREMKFSFDENRRWTGNMLPSCVFVS